jgi:hypothetical protein
MKDKIVGHLRKPIAPELLIEIVRTVLKEGRLNGNFV